MHSMEQTGFGRRVDGYLGEPRPTGHHWCYCLVGNHSVPVADYNCTFALRSGVYCGTDVMSSEGHVGRIPCTYMIEWSITGLSKYRGPTFASALLGRDFAEKLFKLSKFVL
jgi:hypothetical protein